MMYREIIILILLPVFLVMLSLSVIGCGVETLPEGIEEKIIEEIDSGQYAEALDDLDKMEKFAPVVNIGWVYGERGYVYFLQGKNEAAVDELTKAIEIEPSRVYYQNRAYAFEKLGKYSEAEADYNAAIELEPNNYRGYEERAGFYRNISKWSNALLNVERAIALAPDVPRLYVIRADIRVAMRDPNLTAITADLRKVLELQSSGPVREDAIRRLKMLGIEP